MRIQLRLEAALKVEYLSVAAIEYIERAIIIIILHVVNKIFHL